MCINMALSLHLLTVMHFKYVHCFMHHSGHIVFFVLLSGMLKCKDSSFCIPHSEMCDGVVHCKQHREDEKYCGVIGGL